MDRFTDGQTVYFLMRKNGELLLVDKEIAEAAPGYRGSATIERIDRKTNTITFTAPLPEGVRMHKG